MSRPSAQARERIWSRLKALDQYKLMTIENAGSPDDGITGVGIAGTGCLCIDRTNGYLWQNEGTSASPTWVFVGTQVTT